MRGLVVGLLLVFAGASAMGQDAALRDRVTQLLERLSSERAEDRDAAEAALGALGARVLALLPGEAEAPADMDVRARLARVREAVERASEAALTEPSRVTIEGKGIRLSDALRELQRQTGNTITDLREAYGGEADNPALDLEIKGQGFFEALEVLGKQARFGLDFATGDGSIGLMPAGAMYGQERAEPEAAAPTRYLAYSGPFRVELRQINSERDFTTGRSRSNALFEVAWEPRLRPMLLALRSDAIEIVDDRGETVSPEVMEESMSTVLRPESCAAEVYLNMNAPDRRAQVLKTVRVKSDVTLPAGIKQFRFAKLDGRNQVQTQGDVKLTLVSVSEDEGALRFEVVLEMPGEGPAFESYQQGLFNNRLWLQRADGSRFEHNGGFSTLGVAPGKLGFEYIFVDVPGKLSDYQFVYETPSRVVTVPLEFTFENVPLP